MDKEVVAFLINNNKRRFKLELESSVQRSNITLIAN